MIDEKKIPASGLNIKCPNCKIEVNIQNPLLHTQTFIKIETENDKNKKYEECPFCKEKIKSGALKCRYCGEYFSVDAEYDAITKENEKYGRKLTTSNVEKERITPNDGKFKNGISSSSKIDTAEKLLPREAKPKETEKTVKVGGWLKFFCITLVALGPLLFCLRASAGWESVKPLFVRYPVIKTALTIEYIGFVLILLYGVFVGVVILNGSSYGRKHAQRYLLVRLFGVITYELLAIYVLSTLPSRLLTIFVGEEMIQVAFREGIYFLIWWLYFKYSKRVKETYSNNYIAKPTAYAQVKT
jgi:hypothetical protein